jgi:Predicted metal-dependent hydrolase
MNLRLKKVSKTPVKSNIQVSKLHIDDLEVSLLRKDIRSLRLSITREGKIRLSIPYNLRDSEAEKFLISKLQWIRKHLERIGHQKALEPEDLSTVQYLGNSYRTQVFSHPISPRVVIDSSERICIFLKPGIQESAKANVLDAWYRSELKKMIAPLIKEWEPVMGVQVQSFHLKRMKTRWGTCNVKDHRIWFNAELAKKSFPCIEYIVVHEMTHLLERGHGPKFKAYMDRFLPNWRELRNELNGKLLE